MGENLFAPPMGSYMWKRVLIYGVILAAGTTVLQALDYMRVVRSHAFEVTILLVALGFMGLGVWIGTRVLSPKRVPFDGNPQAVAALGISPRELSVLTELAAGNANKEIARRLGIAPDTVKTHLARLYEKLEAKNRTDAINRARELGILR